MKTPISDAQWAAARAMAEGEPTTHSRIAGAMGVNVTTVSHRAAEEKWQSLDFRHARIRQAQLGVKALAGLLRAGEELDPNDEAARDAMARAGMLDDDGAEAAREADAVAAELAALPPAARIARIGSILIRRTEAMLARAETGQPVESRQVQALTNLVQLSERIAAMAQQEIQASTAGDDDALAQLLSEIDERIIVLAKAEARRLAVDELGLDAAEVDEKFRRLWLSDDDESE
jgi:hypothetical protein